MADRRETIVWRDDGGLPYSKGLMAQALSASGLAPERSWTLARLVEGRLSQRPGDRIEIAELRALTEEVLGGEEGEHAVRRFHEWQRLDKLDRPLIVLISGTTGVGKSTIATMLAGRLGVTRVIATDVIRQVLRAFFTRDFMPAVNYSAFEAGAAVQVALEGVDDAGDRDEDVVGFERQAESVGTGVSAIVERACREGTPLVVEGVHLVPGSLGDELRARCVAVEAVIVVDDEEMHRSHFAMRGAERPAERYLARFEQIRKLQDYLAARAAEERVAVIENLQVDQALGRLQDLVLDTAARLAPEQPGTQKGAT